MRCFLIIPILLILSETVCSQQIEGKVIDQEGNAVSFATVQLMDIDTSTTITYSLVNHDGEFRLNPPEKKDYLLRVSHVNFENLYFNLRVEEGSEVKNLGELKLFPKEYLLEELTIGAPKAAISSKGDTLTYNLELFLNGREQYLKDIINALPGLSIDKDGMIKANGRHVSELLIDGENLFGDNHKIITDNLRGDMVDGVEIFQNYSRNQVTKDIDNRNEIAMNVSIKEDAKGKLTGEINMEGAYKVRYGFGGSAFRFMPKSKMVLVGNANNLNQTLVSNKDLINYQTAINGFNEENNLSLGKSSKGLPDFIKTNPRVSNRDLQLAAMGWTRPVNEKTKVRAQVLINNQSELEELKNQRTVITPADNLVFLEERQNELGRFLGNGLIGIERSNGNKSHLETVGIFRFNQLSGTEQIFTEEGNGARGFDFSNNGFSRYYGYQLDHSLRLKSNLILSTELFFEYENSFNRSFLFSELPIFDFENNSLNQRQNNRYSNVGLKSSIKYSLKNFILAGSFYGKSSYSNVDFSLLDITSQRIQLEVSELGAGAYIQSSKRLKFQYKIGTDLSYLHLSQFDEPNSLDRKLLWLPKTEFRYDFSKFIRLSTFYSRSFTVPNVNFLLTSLRLYDFRNIYQGSDVFYNDISVQNNIGLQYVLADIYSGTTAYIFGNYANRNNIVSTDNSFSVDFNTMTYTLGQEEDRATFAAGFETRLGFIPMIFKTSSTFFLMNSINFLEGSENPFQVQSINAKVSLRSFGAGEKLNFETGIEINSSTTTFDLQNAANNFTSIAPFVSLEGELFTDYLWSISHSYTKFNTNSFIRALNVFDLQFRYKLPSRPWEIGLIASDLLNIGSSELLQATVKGNQFQQTVFGRIPGYLGIRVNHRF